MVQLVFESDHAFNLSIAIEHCVKGDDEGCNWFYDNGNFYYSCRDYCAIQDSGTDPRPWVKNAACIWKHDNKTCIAGTNVISTNQNCDPNWNLYQSDCTCGLIIVDIQDSDLGDWNLTLLHKGSTFDRTHNKTFRVNKTEVNFN